MQMNWTYPVDKQGSAVIVRYTEKYRAYLVKCDIIVKGNKIAGPGGPEPGECVAAHRQQHQRHVQLQRLGRTFGRRQAIPHHSERLHASVLHEFPDKKCSHHRYPEHDDPGAAPVLLCRVPELGTSTTNAKFEFKSRWSGLGVIAVFIGKGTTIYVAGVAQISAPIGAAHGAQWPAVVHVCVSLEQ
jgi:hypothetical protein